MENLGTLTETGAPTLHGTVVRVLFHKAEDGFCALLMNIPGQAQPVRVCGTLGNGNLDPGEEVECSGAWEHHKTYGPQFKASLILTALPRTAAGIERYLASGVVRGIGPKLAKRLVQAFGVHTVKVIDEEPERLLELPGIGRARVDALRAAWAEQRNVQKILIFLREHGVGTALALRIHKVFGANAISAIRQDPYRLAREIRGIGFLLADRIAQSFNIPLDSPTRVQAGVLHSMNELAGRGHCASTMDGVISDGISLLGVATSHIEAAVRDLVTCKELVVEETPAGPRVFLTYLYKAEIRTAASVARILSGHQKPWNSMDPKRVVELAEDRTGFSLSPSQVEALTTAISKNFVVITGGPGVGKTALVNGILAVVKSAGGRVILCAPTGRAAKRMTESTGCEAMTIHRTLEYNPSNGGFQRDADNPLQTDLVVVDEVSMVDLPLMAALLGAIERGTSVLLVGDADQLPSVGPGTVLADFIESGVVPTIKLTEIFRQAAGSMIITNAHRINKGQMPEARPAAGVDPDFFVVQVATPEEGKEKLLQVVTERIPGKFGLDPLRDIQVLTPMNKGDLGTKTLNSELQARLNPVGHPKVTRFGTEFRVGDKVIQKVNNYDMEVFNGDIGQVVGIDLEATTLTVEYDGRRVEYAMADLDGLALAYATTIHKSQGSEYPAVVIILSTQHYIMLERNLLYTGVTRGKRLVVVICQEKALAKAVANRTSRTRMTGLLDRLQSVAKMKEPRRGNK